MSRTALASCRCASQEGCAAYRAPRKGRQAAAPRLRRALTARAAPASPLVRGTPISGRGSHCKGGVASTTRSPPKLWGGAWPQVQSRLVAALRHYSGRALLRGLTPPRPESFFRKMPFRTQTSASEPRGHGSREVCFLFQIILVTLTVQVFRSRARGPASPHPHLHPHPDQIWPGQGCFSSLPLITRQLFLLFSACSAKRPGWG